MANVDPSNILSYGVIGLGFLLALLAYRLLGREQQTSAPRKSILVAIHVFMIFSVVLCLIGFGSEILKARGGGDLKAENNELHKQIGKQTIVIQKYKNRQAEYVATFKTSKDTIRPVLALFPERGKSIVLEAFDKLQPRTVEE